MVVVNLQTEDGRELCDEIARLDESRFELLDQAGGCQPFRNLGGRVGTQSFQLTIAALEIEVNQDLAEIEDHGTISAAVQKRRSERRNICSQPPISATNAPSIR